MITKIQTKNYRNLEIPDGVELRRLNILVGANGSGKSNFVEILKFLKQSFSGSIDEKRGATRFEDAVNQFGSGTILNSLITEPANVTFEIDFELQKNFIHGFKLSLQVKDESTVTIRGEELTRSSLKNALGNDPFYYYRAHEKSLGSGVVFMHKAKQGEKRFETVNDLPNTQLAIDYLQRWLEENSKNSTKDTPFFEGRRLILDAVSDWVFYESASMNVSGIRKARPEIGQGDAVLSPSGENLPLVLFNLWRDHVDFRGTLVEAMQEIFPQTSRLDVVPVGRITLTVEWYLQNSKKPFFLDRMSDGTVRMLCWASVLLSPQLPSLIVLDEPEAGLHPAWLKVLAGWIGLASRRTQVIVSTHSPDLLDHFTDTSDSVLVFERSSKGQESTVKRLNPEVLAPDLEAGWRLGDLYRAGHPAIGGWAW